VIAGTRISVTDLAIPDLTSVDGMLAPGIKDGMASMVSLFDGAARKGPKRSHLDDVVEERPFTPRETVWPLKQATAKQKKALARTAPGPNPVLVTLLRDWDAVDTADALGDDDYRRYRRASKSLSPTISVSTAASTPDVQPGGVNPFSQRKA